jgi:hypothetical protein
MSSSTSSSEPVDELPIDRPRGLRRWLAWTVPLLVLALLEVTTRAVLVPASRDLRRFSSYPTRARALFARPGLRVALIGNSVTENGVDVERFERTLSASLHRPIVADMLVADGADISTDYWIVERWLWKADLRPDLMVVTWFGPGLEDADGMDLGRLARYLTGPEDWGQVFRLRVHGLEDRVEFVLSALSASYAARHRIKERVLDLLPGYEDATTRVNDINFEREHAHTRPHAETHHTLERFLARARQHGVRVCFVAYPSRWDYTIPDEALRMIAEAGMPFIDLRRVAELAPEDYRDHAHLNERGRPIYTDVLARSLSAVWRP